MRILIAAIIIWIGMSLSSHSKIPESKRSQKAEARFAAPLEAALKKKGLYSGELGPKFKQGDGQSPEGFYFVKPGQMNPYSSYHLSFDLGYPNTYDRAHGRTGDYLMVHGDCVSIGCYAMTDAGIEEIYTLMGAALKGGQPFVRVHAFPFPMTEENLKRHEGNKNIEFWKNLKSFRHSA